MNLISPKRKSINISQASIVAPSPLLTDFESFIAWACSQAQIPANIQVSKIIKDDSKYYKKISASKSRQASKSKVSVTEESVNLISKSTAINIRCNDPNSFPIITIYNNNGDIIEIFINNFPFLSQLINIIPKFLQFHNNLYKLTLKRKGVNCDVINKLSKLIECSNLTDVCLDDTYVPEGNYFLLVPLSNLKSLSLSRCNINDKVCKEIAEKLQYSSTSLMNLNLSSNRVLDSGAMYIGFALRKNRSLLHLDVSDNGITDIGVTSLLNIFMEFSLTSKEILEYQIHRGKCLVEKYYSRKKCVKLSNGSTKLYDFKETKCNNFTDIEKYTTTTSKNKIMYVERDIINKNDRIFNVGNLKLCSLNMAYNNITSTILPKICCVLKYQKQILQNYTYSTGILRIVLTGNNIITCKELEEINEYLKQAIKNSNKPRSSIRKKSVPSQISLRSTQSHRNVMTYS